MSENYYWVNVDKKEYLCPVDFCLSGHNHGSTYRENDCLRALRELLTSEWKGSHVGFLGENCTAPSNIGEDLFRVILIHAEEMGYPGNIFDTMCESYRNASCLFTGAKESVREGIGYYLMELRDGRFEHYNEYGIDPANPFNGLFLRAGKTFKYTLNHTKRVGYSLDETIIRYQCGLEAEYSDPLPVLLGCGEHTPEPGPWLGDIVDAADELPLGYDLLKEIYLDW